MIFDYLGDLNWLAVVVATIAWFAFSAVWYSVPPLSQAWMTNAKVDPSQGGNFAAVLAPTLVGYFVTTVVIALLVEGLGIEGAGDGFSLGVALGLGFGVVGALVTQLYEQKGRSYWLVNGVNAVIAYTIVAVILAVWQ